MYRRRSEHVEPCVNTLLEFMESDGELPALIRCAMIHYQFEAIHPFEDGNGRLGRLLMPLFLLRHGVIDRPVLVLSSYFVTRRDEYIAKMRRIETDGEWLEWIMFFLAGVKHQAHEAVSLLQTIDELQANYRARILASRSRSRLSVAAMLELVLERVVVAVSDLEAHAGVSYNAARGIINDMADAGIVEPLAGTYPQRWWARELVERVYN